MLHRPLQVVFFVLICSRFAVSQELVYLSLADDNSFVVTAQGVDVFGINFKSANGGLSPVLTGGVEPFVPTPFSLLLSNTPTNVTYGAAGGTQVRLEGSLKLTSGWDPAATEQDLIFRWGGSSPIDGIMADGFYDGAVPDALPSAFVDENQDLILNNVDEPITSFTFIAQAGLLEGIELPDHWTVVNSSDTEITFTSDTGIAPADFGLVSWGSSFDNNVYVSFTLESGPSFGPFLLPGTENIPEPTSCSLLFASLLGMLALRRRR